MRTTFISTRAMSEATRLTLVKSQARLADASKEVITGRHANVEVALGYKTGQVVSFRQDLTRLTSITDSNNVAKLRLEVTQTALTSIIDISSKLNQSAITYSSNFADGQLVQADARGALNGFIDKLNTSADGAFIFAGINSDVRPVTEYFGTAAQTSVQTAFAALGPPEAITPAAMEAFLADGGPFETLFADPNWATEWSSASDTNIRSRISTTELIETSTNSNEQAFRNMMKAAVMMADLSAGDLQPDTLKAVATRATAVMGSVVRSLGTLQGTLGISQQRINDSNEKMSIQKDIITARINVLEGVDVNEASVRLTALEQQIELSYSITGRLQRLNILDYL